MRLVALIAALALAAAPAHADTIKIARAALPASLGVPFTAIGQPSSEIWLMLFDGLTRLDPKGQIQPALAQSWEVTGPRTWRFHLRPGQKFHNGVPVTADAVIANFELLRSPAGKKFYVAPEVANFASLKKIDDLTFDIETTTPDGILPRRMAMIWVVEPKAFAELGEDGFAQKPVGTGPFKLVDWGRGSAVTKMQANKESWRAPKVDNLELYTVIEPVRRLQALLSGQVHVATRLGPEEVLGVPDRGYTVTNFSKSQVMTLTFVVTGNDGSPVTDVRVRKALSLAVDRDRMVKEVFGGLVKPANQGAAPVTQGFVPDLPPLPFDPKEARRLLEDAGFPKGFPLQVDVFLGQLPADELIFQYIAQSWREIGVNVELRNITFAQWLQNLTLGKWNGADAFGYVWDSSSTYDLARPVETASCAKPNPYFCDQSVMPLVRDTAQEMDPAKRLTRLQELNRQMVVRMPAVYLLNVVDSYAASDKVDGVEIWGLGLLPEKLSLKQ